MDHSDQRGISAGLVLGVILLFVGIAFLLHNFDIIDLGPAIHYWPLIIVIAGLVRFVDADNSRERRHGFWWMVVGFWLLVSVLHMFQLGFHNSWPLLLIGLGVNGIWKAVDPHRGSRFSREYNYGN